MVWFGMLTLTLTLVQEETGRDRLLPWGPVVRGEEDCLVINVYTPSITGARPVMVFIHGGGYFSGGRDPL